MKTRERTSNLVLLHAIVFIWGFTGILGKEISLDTFYLVWWRVFIASMAIGLFVVFLKKSIRASSKDLLRFAGVGLLTAAHWVCFFGSIKASNVSVALAVISTTSFFVALVAPFIRKEKFQAYELLLGLAVMVGLGIIFKFESSYKLGIILSLSAALFAAIFSSYNSKLVAEHSAVKIAFWEMVFALGGVSVFLLFTGRFNQPLFDISAKDFCLVMLLGVVCTGFAFIVGIQVMKVLSPFTCALAINMEPIYTIALALWIYGESEYMSFQFYIGAIILVSALFAEAWLKGRARRLQELGE
jgi:drug/metabolite transporter (DMT)-like permease